MTPQMGIVTDEELAAAVAAHAALYTLHNLTVRKTADEIVNNSIALQNDDHLLFAIGANERWLVDLYLLLTTPTINPDFKLGWAYPAGCLIYWGPEGTGGWANFWMPNAVGILPTALLIQTGTHNISGANVIAGCHLIALVVNGATPGTINFQWAQAAAVAENTTVLTNSCLIARRLA